MNPILIDTSAVIALMIDQSHPAAKILLAF